MSKKYKHGLPEDMFKKEEKDNQNIKKNYSSIEKEEKQKSNSSILDIVFKIIGYAVLGFFLLGLLEECDRRRSEYKECERLGIDCGDGRDRDSMGNPV